MYVKFGTKTVLNNDFCLKAFLIAFTSDFIQKLVYKYEYGERGIMKDYVMFTLSKSPVKNWIDKGYVSTNYESPKLVFVNASL